MISKRLLSAALLSFAVASLSAQALHRSSITLRDRDGHSYQVLSAGGGNITWTSTDDPKGSESELRFRTFGGERCRVFFDHGALIYGRQVRLWPWFRPHRTMALADALGGSTVLSMNQGCRLTFTHYR